MIKKKNKKKKEKKYDTIKLLQQKTNHLNDKIKTK